MISIGIDPGISGGIAVIYPDMIRVIPMPIAGKEIDVMRVVEFLPWKIDDPDILAYVEKVGAFPGQGTVSMWKFGFVTGIIHGVLRTLDIPLTLVTPQAWKKEILAGTDKSKEAAIDWCRRVYPNVNLLATPRSTKPHSGMCDALCIAEYGRRTFK